MLKPLRVLDVSKLTWQERINLQLLGYDAGVARAREVMWQRWR